MEQIVGGRGVEGWKLADRVEDGEEIVEEGEEIWRMGKG